MDEHTPIEVPIRLEEWDRHDCINEVDVIMVDARPILDATDFDHLPAPDDWDADFIAEEAQRLGLLRPWDGPFTVELEECGEYPAYLAWRGTHRVVEGAKERFRALAKDEILSRIERTQAELDRLVAEYKESKTMTIDELIKQLKALPKDVRRRPLMDGKPAVGYRLAPLDHIRVEKVLASNDGFCGMTDPGLTDAENVVETGDRYGTSTHIERRALAFFD